MLVTAPFEDRVEIVRKKRGLNKRRAPSWSSSSRRRARRSISANSAGKWKMTSGKDIVATAPNWAAKAAKMFIAAAYRYKVAQLEG